MDLFGLDRVTHRGIRHATHATDPLVDIRGGPYDPNRLELRSLDGSTRSAGPIDAVLIGTDTAPIQPQPRNI